MENEKLSKRPMRVRIQHVSAIGPISLVFIIFYIQLYV